MWSLATLASSGPTTQDYVEANVQDYVDKKTQSYMGMDIQNYIERVQNYMAGKKEDYAVKGRSEDYFVQEEGGCYPTQGENEHYGACQDEACTTISARSALPGRESHELRGREEEELQENQLLQEAEDGGPQGTERRGPLQKPRKRNYERNYIQFNVD